MIAPADDLDRLMQVMDAAFDPHYGEAWTRRQVEDALLSGACRYVLVDERGEPPGEGAPAAGFSMLRTCLDEEELLLFAVDPRFRSRGLGSRMLRKIFRDAAINGMRRILLEMRRGNPAEHLYRSFGFEPIGQRPNYYRLLNGERIDAITFACDVSDVN